MPCYNDGDYIQESINSVLEQTYPNIEILIVDDGSTDKATKDIIDSIVHQQIKVFRTKQKGPAGARNYAISHAEGKYILPLDSDDLIDASYISKATELLEKDKTIGAVYCRAELFGEREGPWQLPDYSFDHMLLDNIVFVTALFRKEDWDTVGGFSIEFKHGMEDYDFWISILELGKSIYQIKETLFYYRIKDVSRTSRFHSDVDNIKKTYEIMYRRHPKFYNTYVDEYVITLRNALIDQLAINRALKSSIKCYDKITRVPFLKRITKKYLNR